MKHTKNRHFYGPDRFLEENLTPGEIFHAKSEVDGFPFLVSFIRFENGQALFENLEPLYKAMFPLLRFHAADIHRSVFNYVTESGEIYEQSDRS